MLELNNQFYRLSIDEECGRIAALRKNGEELLAAEQPPVFKVRFRDEKGEKRLFTADDPHRTVAVKDGNEIRLGFYEIGGTSLSVELTVREDGTPLSKWNAAVSGELQLEWVEFPCVTVPDTFADNGGGSRLLWPYNEGALIGDIDARENNEEFRCREPEYPSKGAYAMCPGMVFAPFMAVTSDRGGLYFAAHDPAQNTRNVDFFRTDAGVQLKIRLFPGVSGGSYRTECDTVLGVFDGDWYAAAEIYRSWFEQNKPARMLKIPENPNLPEWYSDAPIVITYCVRGHFDTDVMEPNKLFPYINAMKLVEDFSKRLNSRIMVVLMHWEGSAPWAPPYVWPPYGGEAALKEFIDALHAQGHLLGVYCSGFGWTQTSCIAEYHMEKICRDNQLERFMCASPEGPVGVSEICRGYQRFGFDLCPSTDFCKDTIINEARQMAAAGVDYAQFLDQNHGGTSYMCYSKHHGHPPVPGKWENDATAAILQGMREAANGKKILFGCESAAAEVFIPELLFSDNRYEINFNFAASVPLYAYIYHEYVNNFMGNQVGAEWAIDCRASRENLLYRLAYSFVAGDFMTLVINDEGKVQWAWGQSDFSEEYMPDSEAAMTLITNLNRWRRGMTKKYLHSGKMLRPADISADCADTVLKTKAGQLSLCPLLTARYAAADGTEGQIVVNITDSPQQFRLCGADGARQIAPDGTVLSSAEGGVTVAPLDAVMIRLK